jgi:hypothetical protein
MHNMQTTVALRVKAWIAFAPQTLRSWIQIPLEARMSLCIYSAWSDFLAADPEVPSSIPGAARFE